MLVPTDDTFIEGQDEQRRNKVNGTSSSLQVASNNANERKIYLKFDFNGEDLSQIRSAVLRLFNNDTRYQRTITANRVLSNAWTEAELSWNLAPPAGEPITGINGIPVSFETASTGTADDRLIGAKYYELDVTSYFEQVKDSGLISIMVQSSGYTSFASKEYEDGAYPPQLVLSSEEYASPAEPQHRELGADGRSSLYPADWYPGYADEEGRFLHDFSYAGYHMGDDPIPSDIPGETVDVTQAPYHADATGQMDATSAIQAAIDAVGDAGGGVVYLPAGTYKVKPQGTNNQALKLSQSGVVLRGAGPDQTFIYNEEPVMRGKDIITITSEGGAFQPVSGTETMLRTDLPEPTVHIPVQDASAYAPGDWLAVHNHYTEAFIAEHDMIGWWDTYIGDEGVTFYRKVLAVDAETDTLTIDIPTRYALKVRDLSGVYKLNPPVTEVGVERLSIGNVQNLTPGIAESDNTVEGTAGYEVAGTNALNFVRVTDSWAREVHTYRPPTNDPDYHFHILSNGINLINTRNVTIIDCDLKKPLFRGAGGNGYLYEITGNDNLVMDSVAEEGRHNFTFSHMRTSGNVIRDSVSLDPTLAIDFHQYLSASNLLDGMELYGDKIEASVRPYPSSSTTHRHGVTTSQTAIWNTYGHYAHSSETASQVIVDSRQHGYGYIIGTQGDTSNVRVTPEIHSGRTTAPIDYTEGIGQAHLLMPQSLHADQLQKRQARQSLELSSIDLNGKPLRDFQFGKKHYTIQLPYGTATPPVITASAAEEGSTVEVEQASSLPGTATITVNSQEQQTATYTLKVSAASTPDVLDQITLLPDRSQPGWKYGVKLDYGQTAHLKLSGLMSDGTEADLTMADLIYETDHPEVLTVDEYGVITAHAAGSANVTVHVSLDDVELSSSLEVTVSTPVYTERETLPIAALTASGDDGNVVDNIVDGDYDTRWSASGEGQWMVADLGAKEKIDAVSIAFYNGHTRKAIFKLEVSTNGVHWKTVIDKDDLGNSSGDSTVFELFELSKKVNARYVRYMGYGNSDNAWNSITEFRVHPAKPSTRNNKTD